jgi:hypothetical protein
VFQAKKVLCIKTLRLKVVPQEFSIEDNVHTRKFSVNTLYGCMAEVLKDTTRKIIVVLYCERCCLSERSELIQRPVESHRLILRLIGR